ncbi:hypothetical protein XENOCAPTIV_020593, partial [Xenoophorus captivus]
KALADYSKDFVVSVVLGKDLGCWYELFGGDPDDFPTEMDSRREEQLSQPLLGEESLVIRHSSSYQSLASDDSPAHTAAHLPLFPPGRILHITEDGPSRRIFIFLQRTLQPRMITDADSHMNSSCPYVTGQLKKTPSSTFSPTCSSFVVFFHRSCFSQVRYRADWSSEMAFRGILISPRMLVDHMPDAVLRALNSLCSDSPFSLCPSSLNNNPHTSM